MARSSCRGRKSNQVGKKGRGREEGRMEGEGNREEREGNWWRRERDRKARGKRREWEEGWEKGSEREEKRKGKEKNAGIKKLRGWGRKSSWWQLYMYTPAVYLPWTGCLAERRLSVQQQHGQLNQAFANQVPASLLQAGGYHLREQVLVGTSMKYVLRRISLSQ